MSAKPRKAYWWIDWETDPFLSPETKPETLPLPLPEPPALASQALTPATEEDAATALANFFNS